jgi:hypothetical protein
MLNLLLTVVPTRLKPARFKLKIIMPVVIGKITTAKNINISITQKAFSIMRIFLPTNSLIRDILGGVGARATCS